MIDSRAFQTSSASRKLLAYLGERTLARAADELKEYTIGVEALDRAEGYDPQVDPSVRVQVSRLRKRLERYYEEEGSGASVRIRLPKGQFGLRFEQMQASPIPQSEPHRAPVDQWKRLAFALAAMLLAVSVFAFRQLGDEARAAAPAPADAAGEFWAPYVDSDLPAALSLGVATFLRVPGTDPRATTYLRQSGVNEWPPAEQVPGLDELRTALGGGEPIDPMYGYCGVGEAVGSYQLGKSLNLVGLDLPIVRSPFLSWDEAKGSNLIFVGPPKFNRQIEAAAYERNFRVVHEGIENVEPAPGELAFYREEVKDGELRSVYGVISRFPNGAGPGVVTVFASNDGAGTWGAVEHVTRPDRLAELLDRIRPAGGGPPDSFEILVHARCDQDYPIDVEYVAHRVY